MAASCDLSIMRLSGWRRLSDLKIYAIKRNMLLSGVQLSKAITIMEIGKGFGFRDSMQLTELCNYSICD